MFSSTPVGIATKCFLEARQLTTDFLSEASAEVINASFPRPTLVTIGQQIAEMADVTFAYAHSIDARRLDFSTVRLTFPVDLATQPYILLEYLQESTHAMRDAIVRGANAEENIGAYGEEITLLELIIGLVQHETLHLGHLVSFLRYNRIEPPARWIAWMMCEDATGQGYGQGCLI